MFFLDINECDLGTDDCIDNAECSNTIGSFTCTCSTGYTGDGETCTGKILQCFRRFLLCNTEPFI